MAMRDEEASGDFGKIIASLAFARRAIGRTQGGAHADCFIRLAMDVMPRPGVARRSIVVAAQLEAQQLLSRLAGKSFATLADAISA